MDKTQGQQQGWWDINKHVWSCLFVCLFKGTCRDGAGHPGRRYSGRPRPSHHRTLLLLARSSPESLRLVNTSCLLGWLDWQHCSILITLEQTNKQKMTPHSSSRLIRVSGSLLNPNPWVKVPFTHFLRWYLQSIITFFLGPPSAHALLQVVGWRSHLSGLKCETELNQKNLVIERHVSLQRCYRLVWLLLWRSRTVTLDFVHPEKHCWPHVTLLHTQAPAVVW